MTKLHSSKAVHDALLASGPDSRFIEMDTARFLAQDNETRDAVIVDPPRTGLHKKVIGELIAMQPELLIYISCDPSTLARDSKLLAEGGFVPQQFIPFDFFPQTYHIETLSIWTR